MNTLGKDEFIRPLCPAFILDHHRAGESEGTLDATVIDIDISGFTKVTDDLSGHGPQGAELLAEIMRSVFEPLTYSVHEYEGFVAHFSGDGFLALFPGADLSNGVAAAWLMRQTIRSRHAFRTPFGTFLFKARIGISSGALRWRICSDAAKERHVYHFDGQPIIEAARVRQAAGLGELFITADASAQLSDNVVVQPSGMDFLVTDADNLTMPVAVSQTSGTALSYVKDFFPDTVANFAGLGEFRQAVIVFVRMENPSNDLPRFAEAIFAAQERLGGHLNGIADGDKGCTAFLFWGAPAATENDVSRALEFVSELLTCPDLTIRAGLTYGLCHAGFSGSSLHQDYTCTGSAVNLASRLMTAAKPGQVLINEAVVNDASQRFEVDFVGELKLKGLVKDPHVFSLGRRRQDVAQTIAVGTLVDRDKELDQLNANVERILTGERPGVVLILGGVGSGKTSVVSTLATAFGAGVGPQRAAVQKIWFIADSLQDQQLGPFRRQLRAFFGITQELTASQKEQQFSHGFQELLASVQGDPVVDELTLAPSFLAALVDVHRADSAYLQVNPELRARNTIRALVAFFQALAIARPLVLCVDDLHAFDAESRNVFEQIAQQQRPALAIVASSRIDDDSEPQDLPFEAQSDVVSVTLGRLTADGVRKVANQALGAPVSSRVVEFLLEKTSGNPLYLEQLLLTLGSRGAFVHRGETSDQRIELAPDAETGIPPGINGILVARVDRLPMNLKTVVQVAAVLGYEFSADLLRSLLPEVSQFDSSLQAGIEQKIWVQTSPSHFRFRHALLRDTVYDMQLVVLRKQLHQRAVHALEEMAGPARMERLAALAYHSESAKLSAEAQKYLLQAGDLAHANLDTASAVHFYRRLLQYAIDDQLEVSICTKLGTLLGLTGDWEDAEAFLDRGLTGLLQSSRPFHQIEILTLLGDVLRKSGDYAKAREKLELAFAIARRSGDKQMMGRVLVVLAGSYKYAGDYPRSQDIYSQALKFGEEVSDDNIVAVSLAGIASTNGLMGNLDRAIEFNCRAIPMLEKAGNRQELIYPLGNLGIDLFTSGEYDEALEILDRSLKECMAIGDREGIWIAYHFMGLSHHRRGEVEQAIELYNQALQERDALGGDGIPYDTRPHLASAHAATGKQAAALGILLNLLTRFNAGEPDREHGLIYLEIAGFLMRFPNDQTMQNDGAVRDLLDQLIQTGPGPDPVQWLERAEQSAVAGRSLGFPVRIGVLRVYAQYLCTVAGVPGRGANVLAAAHKLATQHALGGEDRAVRGVAQSLGIDLEGPQVAPDFHPFTTD